MGGPAWTPARDTVLIPMAGLFGLAGIALVGFGLLQLASGDHAMVGANLSAGVASVAAAVAAGASTVVRRRRPA